MRRGSAADNVRLMLMQDPRKSATLGALLLLLIVLGVRQFTGYSPASAPAATDSAVPNVAQSGQEAVSRALASLDQSRGGGIVAVPMPPEMARDLFALHPDHFPEPAQAASPAQERALKASSAPAPVESEAENADVLRARREAQLVEETKGWSVRSLMLGSSPTAVIETAGAERRRSVVRPGSSVQGWTLVEAGTAGVVLEKQGIRVRLPVSADR